MNIEERLKMAIDQSSHSGILWSQWSFDKILLMRSLNVISSDFPHYSLHESSHSNSVLLEIEKILGSNIEKLSYIDAWLLLEASYWHDVGMIVTAEEKDKIIKNLEFKTFIEQLSTRNNDLSEYAKIYLNYTEGNPHPSFLELEKSFVLVFAEYIRTKHPERGKKIFLDPTTVGIKSPATGLINIRLRRLLAEIIECHGKSFDSILELPFENDGLDVSDKAHPRFIACMLRIGDLLDLEDGRHCPTLMKTIGVLPSESLAHFQKHRTILSKNVNERYIEITAKCETFETYEVQNDWFSFIQQEFGNQDKHWGEIAPAEILWKLPNLRKLTCELDGCISFGNMPNRLTLDGNRMYEYLSGTNLYGNPFSCINELLQNAVDATIDRIWLEHKDSQDIDITQRTEFIRIAKSDEYKIDIKITPQKSVVGTNVKYEVEIKDNGKGMSIDDIQSLMTIASERARCAKEKSRYGMPDWMRPSGFFGIGLQSVFAVTNQFIIKTQYPNDLSYEILIKRTQGKTPGFIVRQSKEPLWNFGTSVIFSFERERFPLSFSGSHRSSMELRRFDPLRDDILDITTVEIIEIVENFAQFCPVKIYFNNESCTLQKEENTFKPMVEDKENGIEYSLEFFIDLRGGRNTWHYRGRIANCNLVLDYIGMVGNVISGSADIFLTLDRQNFHKSGASKLIDNFKKSLLANKRRILEKITNKKEASLYYFLNDEIDNNDWQSIELFGHEIIKLIAPGSSFHFTLDNLNQGKIDFEKKGTPFISNDRWEAMTLIRVLAKLGRGINIKNIQRMEQRSLLSSNLSVINVYDIEVLEDKATSRISDEAISCLSSQGMQNIYTRYWLPCGKNQYQDLALNVDCINKYPWMHSLISGVANLFPCGIILRSTQKSIEEDKDVLVSVIKEGKCLVGEDIGEAQIQHSLDDFYAKFSFESKKSPALDLLHGNAF